MRKAPIHTFSDEELLQWLLSHTYLDPLWDASFKLLIADPGQPQRLVHFLNALLRLEGDEQIITANLQVQEHPGPLGYEKGVRFDIHCVNQRDEPIVVEMQRQGTNLFKDRMLYYAATAIRKALTAGTKSYRLPRVYVLSLMNFCFEPEVPRFHRTVQLVEREDDSLFYDKLTFVYIELPHFHLKEHELQTLEEKWLYALKHMGELKARPAGLEHPIFADLFRSAKICRFESDTLQTVVTHMRDEASYNDDIAYTEEKAEARGRMAGQAEGRREVARQMRVKGLDWALIQEMTGISPSELNVEH